LIESVQGELKDGGQHRNGYVELVTKLLKEAEREPAVDVFDDAAQIVLIEKQKVLLVCSAILALASC
jgi:hypothetical protein